MAESNQMLLDTKLDLKDGKCELYYLKVYNRHQSVDDVCLMSLFAKRNLMFFFLPNRVGLSASLRLRQSNAFRAT